MKKQTLYGIALMAAVALLASVMTAGASYAMQARPTAIAVVDVMKVLEGLHEKPKIEAEIKTMAQKVEQEIKDRGTKVQQLKEDLDMLAPGTAAHTEKLDKYEYEAFALQTFARYQEQKIKREQSLQYEAVYRKILDSAGKVAQEAGYDMVVLKDRLVNFGDADPKQLRALFSLQKLLWSKPDLDLTEQITLRMNTEFDNNVR